MNKPAVREHDAVTEAIAYEDLCLYIDGEFSRAAAAASRTCSIPPPASVIGKLPHATRADLDRALAAAAARVPDLASQSRRWSARRSCARSPSSPASAPRTSAATSRSTWASRSPRPSARSTALRRSLRLACRRMPPHLRPRDPAAHAERAAAGAARAGRRLRRVHAVELPLQPGDPQDRRGDRRRLHDHHQGSGGFAQRGGRDRAHVP